MGSQLSTSNLNDVDASSRLGAVVGIYRENTTLSGKVVFTGMALMVFCLLIDMLVLQIASLPSYWTAVIGLAQGVGLVGNLLSFTRKEAFVTPWFAKCVVVLYEDGFVYRKKRTRREIRWEHITSIYREFKAKRRNGTLLHNYTLFLKEQPSLELTIRMTNVDELVTFIEQQSTSRLLSQMRTDYEADKPLVFGSLTITKEAVSDTYSMDIPWRRVSQITFDTRTLTIEEKGNTTDWLVFEISDLKNVAVLQALLALIARERDIPITLPSIAMTPAKTAYNGNTSAKITRHAYPRATTWLSTMVLTIIVFLVVVAQTYVAFEGLNSPKLERLPEHTLLVTGPPVVRIKADAFDHLSVFPSGGVENEVRVEGWKHVAGIGKSLADIQEHVTQVGNVIDLSWTMDSSTFLGRGEENVDIFITMPSRGNIEVETRKGDIYIGMIQGDIRAVTQSGKLSVSALLQNHSQLSTTSGNIEYCGSPWSQSSLALKTVSGQIQLHLPEYAAFSISPGSSFAHMHNDFVSHDVGEGPRAQLFLRTQTGHIVIHNEGNVLRTCDYIVK